MDYKTKLGLWIVCSLILSIGGSWLTWRLRQVRALSGDWLKRRLDSPYGQVGWQLVRLAYYVGLPYVVVLQRSISLVDVGLRGHEINTPWWSLGWTLADWSNAMGWIVSLFILLGLALSLGWRNAVRSQEQTWLARGLYPPPPWWITLREVAYLEIHWAFYRAGPLLIFDDYYWGLLVSAAFPLLEWALDPHWWIHINGGPRREQVLMQCLWLAVSTVCFFLTRNLWLTFSLHLGLALGQDAWLSLLAGSNRPVRQLDTP